MKRYHYGCELKMCCFFIYQTKLNVKIRKLTGARFFSNLAWDAKLGLKQDLINNYEDFMQNHCLKIF